MTKLKNLWTNFIGGFGKSSGGQLQELAGDLYEESLNELKEELEKEKNNSKDLNFIEFKVISGGLLNSNDLLILEEYKKSITIL